MIPSLRDRFNSEFTNQKYNEFLHSMATGFGEAATFRICETPLFVPKNVRHQLLEAVEQFNDVITQPNFKQVSEPAMQMPQWIVPNEDEHCLFLQYDFGICDDGNGGLIPQLIELQGFPSLYFFQHLLAQCHRKHHHIPAEYSHLFSGLNEETYIEALRRAIVAGHNPKNVILLEIEPETQNTRIDFWGAQKLLGIKVLCLSKLMRSGKELYYLDDAGNKVPVHRIYNRVIFDELIKRPDLPRQFNLTEEIDAEWAGHPNWFMKISKYTMPSLSSRYMPETWFVHQLPSIPDDLENYVLKPLFSFSGEGVKFHVQKSDITSLEKPEDFILQRKVNYARAVRTPNPDEPAKCEIRMMMIWEKGTPRPQLVNNLIRVTKGEMVGVKYNKNKEWVGASVGFFEPE